ncbi:PQQ-dependent sugar dehydrogenase [Pseudohongiella sp.]|uniref:Pyrroloquinoline quinone-dependent pyranose dehydrogenase beta-propeller domain-containing protein n=1 Tax=marine sediment metagenome TaxID=412755 RepID=A0A0F9Z3Z9_9ZZZZ|nr:sorbosone dehydrogenase family protein [Pseudohongiella sp.]HDZ08472.1 sorbosone dehydrogenase family protein [Pseudohongiella sp.]HEA61790.1 sorbosone dehydrogenase family protein [Pseudohongiella sp.]
MKIPVQLAALAGTALISACGQNAQLPIEATMGPDPQIAESAGTMLPTINIPETTGWPQERTPVPAEGTEVSLFAADLQNPRWLYELPNGDILVAESKAPAGSSPGGFRSWVAGMLMSQATSEVPNANRITLLRDADNDGVVEERHTFLENLNSPFGMALVDDHFYVANADALVRFPYQSGQDAITAAPELVQDLTLGSINHHWTKSLLASPDGEYLYIGVGSNSNVAENGMDEEEGRAAIWQVDVATGESRIYAQGLRNPVGMAWQPQTGELWVAVNERDELGSDLVPDYMTSVSEDGFYGWPWRYYGSHVDQRVEAPMPYEDDEVLTPDYALGAHTASLGLAWLGAGAELPAPFARGMLVGQHGSWNRDPLSGYKVIFVPFGSGETAGEPDGNPVDLLTGFLSDDESQAYGRPVGVLVEEDSGSVLVADDVGGRVWRVTGR